MRQEIMKAVTEKLGDTRNCDLETIKGYLKGLGDTQLIAFAMSLGIDTDAIILGVK